MKERAAIQPKCLPSSPEQGMFTQPFNNTGGINTHPFNQLPTRSRSWGWEEFGKSQCASK